MAEKVSNKKRRITALIVMILCIVMVIAAFSFSGNGFGSLSFFSNNGFDTSDDFVRILDVGQGDSILIYSNGYSAIIDTGTIDYAGEICATLDSCQIDAVDVLILTHLHSDHTGGVKRITELYGIKNVILPEISIESEGLTAAELAINTVTSSGGGIYTATEGMNFNIGEFELTVLASYADMADENDRSVIIAAEIANRKFLFAGDAEAKAEKKLLSEGLELECDVLKVGHHGSNTSSSEDFLKAVNPQYAVISVGTGNPYGHPHNEVLAAFEKIDAEIFRTDYSGDITFYIKNGNIKLSTEK